METNGFNPQKPSKIENKKAVIWNFRVYTIQT